MSWSEPAHVAYRLDAKLVWGRARYVSVTEAHHSEIVWARKKNVFLSLKPGYQSGAWQPAALIATTPRPTLLAWQENKCFLQAYPFGIIMYNYN